MSDFHNPNSASWREVANSRGRDMEKVQRRLHKTRLLLKKFKASFDEPGRKKLARDLYVTQLHVEAQAIQIQKLIATIELAERLIGQSVAQWQFLVNNKK